MLPLPLVGISTAFDPCSMILLDDLITGRILPVQSPADRACSQVFPFGKRDGIIFTKISY